MPTKGEKQSSVYRLTVQDRFVLNGLLPAQGDITQLRLLRELKEALSFSEAENKALGFTYQGEGAGRTVSWNEAAAKASLKGIQIGPVMFGLINGALNKLNTEKKLTEEQLHLYELFVEQAS